MTNKLYQHKEKNHIVKVIMQVNWFEKYQKPEMPEGSIPLVVAQRQTQIGYSGTRDMYEDFTHYEPFAMERDTFLEIYEEMK